MYEVIGYRRVDMPGDDGTPIKGYSVFFAVEENDDSLYGCSTCKVFFNEAKFPEFVPQLGMKLDVFFNQKGKLQGYRAA